MRILFLIGILIIAVVIWHGPTTQLERIPAVAGQFYPADKDDLHKKISMLFKKASSNPLDNVSILIVPHAGYQYSGGTAAQAYQTLRGKTFDTIVLLGPQHRHSFKGAAVFPHGVWRTPLGTMPIDKDFVQELQVAGPKIQSNAQLHADEHSLEVQLPFLQIIQPQAKIVPILVNDLSFAPTLAIALLEVLRKTNKRVLLIASTDMSHYLSRAETQPRDAKARHWIETINPCALKNSLKTKESELCGAAAVLTVLWLLQKTPEAKIDLIGYTTSGEVTGDYAAVVGYGSWAAVTGGWGKADKEALTLVQRQTLLRIARKTLDDYITTGQVPEFSINDPQLLSEHAVFITLRDKKGRLRGCIGRTKAEESLYQAVVRMTIETATQDSRFSPVSLEELRELDLEISILSPLKDVPNTDAIALCRDGVLLSRADHRGVFLPDVAEHYSTRESFLGELCHQKAGLERECWKDPTTDLKIFTSQHFREQDLLK